MFSKCYDCWTLPRPSTRSHTSYLPTSCDTTALVEMSCNGWPAFSATGASKFLSKANTLHLPLSRQAYHRVVFWDICYSLSSSTTCQKKNSSTCRLFADDSFLYKGIRNQQDAQALQQDLTNGRRPWKCPSTQPSVKSSTLHGKKLQSTLLTSSMTTHYN